MSGTEHRIEFRGQADSETQFYSLTLQDGAIDSDEDVVYPHDRISANGLHASGVVVDGTDAYRYVGEVEHVYADPKIDVALDGSVIEPGSLAGGSGGSIPEVLAREFDAIEYDGETLDVDGLVSFNWSAVETFFGIGGG